MCKYAIVLLVCLLNFCIGFDLTLVNEYPLLRDDDISYLKCVTDSAELTQNSFKRLQDTGSGTRLPSYSLVGPLSSDGWPGRRLSLFADSGLERSGVFSCEAKDDSTNILQKVVALKIGTGAQIWPEYFTYTGSVGDSETTLKFESFDPTSSVTWRFQGQVISASTMTYEIRSITQEHAGIYECYRSKEDRAEDPTYRPLDKALLRLIVRGCEAGKWGYPSCENLCECINGAACDENTGECVCPPGFKGDQCEIGCGGNRFGSSCQHRCKETRINSDDEACRGRQFCLRDPYGCSCAAGFSGVKCINGCPIGTYGADCKQECHCKQQKFCDRFSGSCTLGCATGWSGSSCQYPCESGKWGENCEYTCHCYGGAVCDVETGKCPGGRCEPPFRGESCQVDSLNECESNPCKNGGSCVDEVHSYRCLCVNGTSGRNCEIDLDDCSPNPCLNEGLCKDAGASRFICFCGDGFSGDTCETNIDDCSNHECKNNAKCVDDVESYRCICNEDYGGNLCEYKCTPGSFYIQKEDKCQLCEENFYQDSPGKAACIACPNGFVTTKKGSKNKNECKAEVRPKEIPWTIIGAGAGGIIVLLLGIAALWYYCKRKNKTRLQHLGPGRSAW